MTPDVGDLCVAGEIAFANDEFEEAEAWYELACAGRYRDPRPGFVAQHGQLIDNRFARWEQLHTMMYVRSVRRAPGSPDVGHVLVVQSCIGREASVVQLQETMNGTAWRGNKILIVDGATTGERQGQAKTFFQALRQATRTLNFTALTLLEDDVVLAKNALDYIATTKIDDDLAFISWFSTDSYLGARLSPLLNCIEAIDYQFNQAITFPARTVHELLASDALKNWTEPHGADRIYAKVFPIKKVAVHYPNLAQHVGGVSSLVGNNHQGMRTSPSFIGTDVDALGLLR